MNILEKNQIDEMLGKYGFWNVKKDYSEDMQYLGGIPSIDKLIEDKKIDTKSAFVTLELRPKGLSLSLFYGLGKAEIGFYIDKLNFWTIEQQEEVVSKKSKSVIGRALLGGILLGPVGAVVGGMTGIGEKETKISASGIDNIVSISYSENDNETITLLNCSNKKVKNVFEYLKRNFGEKYKKPEEIKFGEKENLGESKISVADELRKLKDLVKEEIITNKEFEEQKKKLLNK